MDRDDHPGKVSAETISAEESEAQMRTRADRPPTEEEAALADRNELDPDVAESYQEANERGANAKGEGRIGGG